MQSSKLHGLHNLRRKCWTCVARGAAKAANLRGDGISAISGHWGCSVICYEYFNVIQLYMNIHVYRILQDYCKVKLCQTLLLIFVAGSYLIVFLFFLLDLNGFNTFPRCFLSMPMELNLPGFSSLLAAGIGWYRSCHDVDPYHEQPRIKTHQLGENM